MVFDAASKKASGFEKSVNQTKKSLLAMLKEKYQILLEAKDRITPTVKQAITYVKSLTSKAWKVTLKAVDLVTSPRQEGVRVTAKPACGGRSHDICRRRYCGYG